MNPTKNKINIKLSTEQCCIYKGNGCKMLVFYWLGFWMTIIRYSLSEMKTRNFEVRQHCWKLHHSSEDYRHQMFYLWHKVVIVFIAMYLSLWLVYINFEWNVFWLYARQLHLALLQGCLPSHLELYIVNCHRFVSHLGCLGQDAAISWN